MLWNRFHGIDEFHLTPMTSTIRDVAKKAKVGIATVSRVLNNSPSVSEETRRRVLKTIADLDYTPNPSARRLSLGRTLTIGVILPFLTLPSFVERLRGIQHALSESEYDLVLFSVGNAKQKDQYFYRLANKSRVDGLLIISLAPSDAQAQRFNQSRLPTVIVDGYHPDLCSIHVDDFEGGRMATQHLIDLGHTRIGFISDVWDTPFNFVAMKSRYDGYRQALKDSGIKFNPEYHQQGEIGAQEAFKSAEVLLELTEPPTAIFAASDTYAISAIRAAQELDIRVPDGVSIIGYDGIRDAEYMNLTTILQPLYDSGVQGVNMLLSAMDTNCQPKGRKLPIQFISGGTTSTPPG
jgi:DNA-binding LacI/PurR family transcriptional regulator